MGIALTLILAPWISVKGCYYFDLIETANYMGILMACDEEDYDLGMGEEASKGYLRLNHYDQDQPGTYMSMTYYYNLTMDSWPGELWDFELLELDQTYNDITLAEMIIGQLLIGLLWITF